MYFVYILLSINDPKKYYIGVTDNLDNRLKRHNSGCEFYTKSNAPWKLETYIAFDNKQLAYSFERYLKHGSGHAFLKRRFLPEMDHCKYGGEMVSTLLRPNAFALGFEESST